MAPDIGFSEFYQRPQEQPDFSELLTEQMENLPRVEREAITFIEEAEGYARKVLDPQYHDRFQLKGVLIDRINGDLSDENINCMPIGSLSTHTLPPVATIVVMGLGCATVDFDTYNDPQGSRLQCTPRIMYTRRFFAENDPTNFHYVEPRTANELRDFIFEEKIPYF